MSKDEVSIATTILQVFYYFNFFYSMEKCMKMLHKFELKINLSCTFESLKVLIFKHAYF